MKNVILKIFAVLLTVWYSMSIIGFDVHTCSGSGRSFVVTFVKGLTCEDIHPDHLCDKDSCCPEIHQKDCCCHGHGTVTLKAKSCCSNDYQVLTITGTAVQNDHEHYDECGCCLSWDVDFPLYGMPSLYHENDLIAYVQSPDSGVASACERQAVLRVWRI